MPGRHCTERCGEAGNALVEFSFLAVLLMVPLAYLVIAAFTVQKAAFAVTAAAREAGRAYTGAESDSAGRARAEAAASLALGDHGLELPSGAPDISCGGPGNCLAPGTVVLVRIDMTVALPGLPAVLDGAVPASVAVRGRHREVVDTFRAAS